MTAKGSETRSTLSLPETLLPTWVWNSWQNCSRLKADVAPSMRMKSTFSFTKRSAMQRIITCNEKAEWNEFYHRCIKLIALVFKFKKKHQFFVDELRCVDMLPIANDNSQAKI